jgi:diguanylate cyclase (GGDEF)-like protein/putative nucleotidyltransferase with HDIG domain
MTYVPYLYVNLTALCSFALLLLAFLASKKTSEVRAFIVMLLACILWVGGSILMRLQVVPGIHFWFHVSIVALFTIPALAYEFICNFAKLKKPYSRAVITVGTVTIDLLTIFDFVLSEPVGAVHADGGIVFTYDMKWPIIVVAILALIYLLYMVKVFVEIIHKKGKYYPGIRFIIISCAVMIFGNMIQILPGNIFPFDALAGIFFAVFLMLALYQKHMFHLSLLISRSFVIFGGLLICAIGTSFFVTIFRNLLMSLFKISSNGAIDIVILLFALLLDFIYHLLNRVVDNLFSHTSDHSRVLQRFSDSASQSLSTSVIVEKLVETIKSEVPVEEVNVCLASREGYQSFNGKHKLSTRLFSVSADSAYVKYFENTNSSYYMMSDFRTDPLYRSVWKNEKILEKQMSVACVFAIRSKNEISGLVLLSEKQRNHRYTYLELDYIATAVSIASIALKNAILYEKMYREARIDSLTDTYNYRYFAEQTNVQFDEYQKDSLALLFVDIDDFRLYNQIYGTLEGDHILKTVADIMKQCIGESGSVYRYSGKIFAALLPHYDGKRTEKLAKTIRLQLSEFNAKPERKGMQDLSVSCGICVSPYGASSAKELIEHADLAVFNAKNFGKDQINQFRNTDEANFSVSDRVAHVMEKIDAKSSPFGENMATIHALTAAIDAKDHYTFQHSKDVAIYAAALAVKIGFNDEQIAMIYEGGLLHDIGKISMPEMILSKTSALTASEYEIMKSHVNNSIDIIRHLPDMEYVVPIVIGHHERWDGRGYPRGLKGEENSLPARCLSLADTYDALTSDRPYRKGISCEKAASVIEAESGKQFDPELSAVFVKMIRSGELTSLRSMQEIN